MGFLCVASDAACYNGHMTHAFAKVSDVDAERSKDDAIRKANKVKNAGDGGEKSVKRCQLSPSGIRVALDSSRESCENRRNASARHRERKTE